MRDSGTAGVTTIRGARVMLADDLVETDVTFADGSIAAIGSGLAGDTVIDARGLILAPALVDLHGDAFERQIMPRPGVFIATDTAVLETDRQLAANGIATAYHAITLGWGPGLRSVGRGRDLITALSDLAPRLTVENRVQLRWETFAFEAVDLIEEMLAGPLTPSLAFNDHTSMAMRGFDVSIQDRAFEFSPEFTVADPDDPRMEGRVSGDAVRSNLGAAGYIAQMKQIWQRRPDVPAMMARVATAARAAGAPMLSHDDTRAETRDWFRDLGSRVCEFPMVLEAAENARSNGDTVIFGAPNVLRGGSHIGSLGAADMVEAGLCDALASDYYYPAMLAAVARLDAERRAPRPALWSLVSQGPARAMHLTDRGRIAPGLRADLVLVDWPEDGAPAIRGTWVAGRRAYAARPADM